MQEKISSDFSGVFGVDAAFFALIPEHEEVEFLRGFEGAQCSGFFLGFVPPVLEGFGDVIVADRAETPSLNELFFFLVAQAPGGGRHGPHFEEFAVGQTHSVDVFSHEVWAEVNAVFFGGFGGGAVAVVARGDFGVLGIILHKDIVGHGMDFG